MEAISDIFTLKIVNFSIASVPIFEGNTEMNDKNLNLFPFICQYRIRSN